MSFVEKLLQSRDELLRLVTGKDQGQDAWWYIRLKPELFEQYKTALKQDSIDLEQYGEVLFSGWGKKPPDEVKKKIEEY